MAVRDSTRGHPIPTHGKNDRGLSGERVGVVGLAITKRRTHKCKKGCFSSVARPTRWGFCFWRHFYRGTCPKPKFPAFPVFFFAHFSFFLPDSPGSLSKYANASNPVFPGPLNFMNCDRTPPYLDTKFTNRGVAKMYISDKNSPYRDVFYRLHGPDG